MNEIARQKSEVIQQAKKTIAESKIQANKPPPSSSDASGWSHGGDQRTVVPARSHDTVDAAMLAIDEVLYELEWAYLTTPINCSAERHITQATTKLNELMGQMRNMKSKSTKKSEERAENTGERRT